MLFAYMVNLPDTLSAAFSQVCCAEDRLLATIRSNISRSESGLE
jgi:hypothetical protein